MDNFTAWDLIQALGTGLLGIVLWVGKGVVDRVAELERTTALKSDMQELRLDFKDHRQETREQLSEINDSVKQVLLKLAE